MTSQTNCQPVKISKHVHYFCRCFQHISSNQEHSPNTSINTHIPVYVLQLIHTHTHTHSLSHRYTHTDTHTQKDTHTHSVTHNHSHTQPDTNRHTDRDRECQKGLQPSTHSLTAKNRQNHAHTAAPSIHTHKHYQTNIQRDTHSQHRERDTHKQPH